MKKVSIIALLVLILDQLSKYIVVLNLNLDQTIKIIDNVLYLTYVKNDGAAWSLFSGSRLFLIVVSILAVTLIVSYIIKEKRTDNLELIALSLIIGGAVGNLIDRLIYGYVIDFIKVIIFDYHYPVFNLSDVCIVIGAILFVLSIYLISKKEIKVEKLDKD